MFQFASPYYLLGLPLLGLLAVAVWWQWQRLQQRRALLGDEEQLFDLSDGARYVWKRHRWGLGLAALCCWVIALANPQFGTRTRIAQVKSTEVMLVLDISESMLAEDVRPSRLSRARTFLQDLIAQLDGEQVGLVVFAGQAYLQVPLTTDYATLELFLRSANPRQAPTQGTNFASAVAVALEVLKPDGEEPGSAVRRLMVVVSDGENHEPLAVELAEQAAEEGVRVITAGLGTAEGVPIPLEGQGPAQYKRDRGGEVVLTAFDAEALQALAAGGNGQYYDLNGNVQGVVGSVASAIADGPSETIGEETFRESASYYQLFVLAGLIFWLAAYWVGRHGSVRELLSPKPRPSRPALQQS